VLLLLEVHITVVAVVIVHIITEKLILDVVEIAVLMAGRIRRLTVERVLFRRRGCVAACTQGTVNFLRQTGRLKRRMGKGENGNEIGQKKRRDDV
jgi:hypothetical protein